MYDLFLKAKKRVGEKELAKDLNVVAGTMRRWEEKKQVPQDYLFDLKRICGEEINWADFSYREKGQFFTEKNTALFCFNTVKEILQEKGFNIDDYIFIEPSAGNGAFTNILPENAISLDIEPRNKKIIKQDFFLWNPPENERYITIGNPPFGLRGQQALKFINKALSFSDFCCFILPPLFNSSGRGNPKDRVKGHLLYSGECNSSFFYPNQEPVKVETIFQIWTSLEGLIEENKEKKENQNIKIFSLSDGGTPSTTRNKDKIGKCDFYLPSTCFGEKQMCLKETFEELPQKRGYGLIVGEELKVKIQNINWEKIAFRSTNGALNLRKELILQALAKD